MTGSETSIPWELPRSDIDDAVEHAGSDLAAWNGARLLITGGTGFIGSWLVATLIRASELLNLQLRLDIITRRPAHVPIEQTSRVRVVAGDVRSIPDLGRFDFVIHGAASSAAGPRDEDGRPGAMAETIIDGTRATLRLASATGAKFLFLSSGAVYGEQGAESVDEDSFGGLDPVGFNSTYAESKRMAENWCAIAAAESGIHVTIARLFAFVGPRLPLNAHFAAGNFLSDVLAQRPILVNGDGRPVRSYLYAGEIAEWLIAILARGKSGEAYNVGSGEPVTIEQLAHYASRLVDPALPVRVSAPRTASAPHRYVPDVTKALTELGLQPRMPLVDALDRTLAWYRSQGR